MPPSRIITAALLLPTLCGLPSQAVSGSRAHCFAAKDTETTWRLEDGDLTQVKTGWGQPQSKRSAANLPLSIGGKPFANGLGVHAPSTITLALDGQAARFAASVGVNDAGGGEVGEVEFKISADGRLVWRSGEVKKGETAKRVDLPLTGVHRLQLEVDPLGSNDSDHADWAEAIITTHGAAPSLIDPATPYMPVALYPPADKLIASPGNTTYYVDPLKGDDALSGISAAKAWKSIAKINALRFGPGDHVVIAPGRHTESLKPSGGGTAEKPVIIELLPGEHVFAAEEAIRLPMFVSNSCDDPKNPKPIGILMQNVSHMQVKGGGTHGDKQTTVVYDGRMVEIFNDHAEDITYSNLVFDLQRPTVSEYRVMEITANTAIIQIAEGSDYAVANGKVVWQGDIGPGSDQDQEAVPAEGRAWRIWGQHPMAGARAEDLGNRRVRLTYPGPHKLIVGHQFQSRHGVRDSVGVHSARSKNIILRDCDFYALTNMGMVSQFTENMSFTRVNVIPKPGTLRTCPAWADIFQFSNCKGDLLVEDCRLSGMQDDAINCHGTHLRIIGQPADNQLLVRFMHDQTYGFAAYAPGDEVAVIGHGNLREYDGNPRRKITAVERKSDREWLLTLDGPGPRFEKDDVLDNITWYPNLVARNNHIDMDPVRGFLLTTRGKVLIENNTFHHCAMAALLMEDDAEGWFESGPVRDLTIRNNRFLHCGISFNPASQSKSPDEPVHENVLIEGNFFDQAGIDAHHVRGLTIIANRSSAGNIPLHLAPTCTQVAIKDNDRKADR